MNTSSKKKKNAAPWLKTRHRIARAVFGPLVALFTKLRYHVRAERFAGQSDRAYLILYNHQTPFDQFFVMTSFRGAVYYLASEDIFSIGWAAAIIRFLAAPIPIRKMTTDPDAIRNMLKVAKEGGTIAIAPEGNRTYSGKTEFMNPSIARLAKKLKLPIALYRIEGGYGIQPRWSDVIRKGSMRAYVSEVIEPETYAAMTDEQLMEKIRGGLDVNEASESGCFRSPVKAEYLERAVYVCPFCGLSVFESSGDTIRCTSCGRTVRYNDDKTLEGVGTSFPFKYVNDWYEYQNDFVNHLDLTSCTGEPLFRDRADIFEVIPYRRKVPYRKDASIDLYGDRIVLSSPDGDDETIPFSDLSAAAVLGRNKLNLYCGAKTYQFKGNKRFNALKYVNFIYRFKNIVNGEPNGKFLGL